MQESSEKKKLEAQKKKELDLFTSEISKKIAKMNNKQTKKRRLFKVNPLVLVVIIIIGVVLLGALINRGYFNKSISISELVDGLNDNKFSQLLIQNDGSIVAKEKDYYINREVFDVNSEGNNRIKISDQSSDFETISLEDLNKYLENESIADTLRGYLSGQSKKLQEILIIDDLAIGITPKGEKDIIINETSKAEIETYLRDKDLNLEKLGIEIKEARVFSQELSKESIESRIKEKQISNVIVTGDLLIAKLEESKIQSYAIDWTPSIFTFTDVLSNEGFSLSSEGQNFEVVTVNVPAGVTLDTVLTVLTIVGFVFLGFIIFRSAQASGMGIAQFGQSKAKIFFGKKTDVTFKDVAGIDEARDELNEIVDFLRNPNKFRKLGARIPKGILMFGPPGTGKTLLARAIAGEAAVPFFHTSGSEFEEMLVGAGASRVRDLFAKAKKAAPALIFIDEIDAVARKRGTRIQSGTTEQTLNQILVEMDGFEKNTNVIVIAATNRPDVLDDAILRPGRFDRQVRIEAPDKEGRLQILQIHSKNKPLAKDVDLSRIAGRTVGFTGADLENIMNEAAIIAAKENKNEINTDDIEEAVSKVTLGPAKKSRKRTDKELELVAYHEAGHALVAKLTPNSIPVDKISITSRGNSGGVTMFIPEKDENIISKKRLIADIRVSLGGRAAEEVALDDISTGASSDIEKATRVARGMIKKFGMSKDLGMVQYGESGDSEYLGYHYGDSKDYSEVTAEKIDSEVRSLIAQQYEEAKKILENNRQMLDKIARLLLDEEVLEKPQFEALFTGNSDTAT